MTYFIGIDQSYGSAGVCIMNEKYEVLDISMISTKSSDGDVFMRANSVAVQIGELVKQYKPVCLGLEGLAFAMVGNATRDLAGLQFVIVTTLRYRYSFTEIVIPAPNEVKKYATGKGNADKAKMHEALPEDIRKRLEEKKYRKTTGLYDVTDAYWIAKYTVDYYQTTQTKKNSEDTRTE